MKDERHQDLAALYALDLRDGDELRRFEAELARDPELRQLIRTWRETSAALAHTAPAACPPAGLKERIFASIEHRLDSATAPERQVIRPPVATFRAFMPWAVAASFAMLATWFAARFMTAEAALGVLQDEARITAVALKSQHLAAERDRLLTGSHLSDLTGQLDARGVKLGEAERQLASLRTQLGDRERAVVALEQRIDALAGASAEVGRQLGEAYQQVAQLARELKARGEVAELKITALASLLGNSPEAKAIAVWDPLKQEGMLQVDKLPALAANEDYQLWVVDPQYPDPVDGGVFTVDAGTGTARVQFHARQSVRAINAFAVTRERKGGVPKAEGPFVLLGK
jgi:anti-sigma-K factor RskA